MHLLGIKAMVSGLTVFWALERQSWHLLVWALPLSSRILSHNSQSFSFFNYNTEITVVPLLGRAG